MDSVGVIGIMSGTSLDGLDLCFVHFNYVDQKWRMSEMKTKAIEYSSSWRKSLTEAFYMSSTDLTQLDLTFGNYIAEETGFFIAEEGLEDQVDLIASHGHTIFHQPQKGFTLQIGNGQIIANRLKKTVVADFRSKDVSLGGQGAPLVPIGDRFLFGEYEACLNLGGIANVSFEQNAERKAFDIAPCNLPLNKIMREQFGKEFDVSGSLAKQGEVIDELLIELNSLGFYQEKAPKSLGVEWMNAHFYPLLNQVKFDNVSAKDLLRTIVEHETDQIAQILNQNHLASILVTGGGAFNTFFIESLKKKTNGKVILPSKEIIAFKEAVIFAFLGLRCLRNEVNALKSVTGASHDSVGGVISYPLTV